MIEVDAEWMDPLDFIRSIRDRPPLAAEKQDVLALLGVSELAGQLADPDARQAVATASLRAAETTMKKLLVKTERAVASGDETSMPFPEDGSPRATSMPYPKRPQRANLC